MTLAVLAVSVVVSAFYALVSSGQAVTMSTVTFVASVLLGVLMWAET